MSIIKGKTNVVAGFGGIKRPLGEVYPSQSSLATDNPGALPGWTGEYYENGKSLFPDLYNFVKAHSELQVTKEQYDNAIATYGECQKYVVDENITKLTQVYAFGLNAEHYGGAYYTLTYPKVNENYWVISNNESKPVTINTSLPTGVITSIMFNDAGQVTSFGYKTLAPVSTGLQTFTYPEKPEIISANVISVSTSLRLPKYSRSHGTVIKEKKPTDTDATWYRQWSDGWLEQGGIISPSSAWSTINLLKPYANTQYIVLAACINGNTAAGVTIKDKTISSFTIYQNVPQNWEAKGYAADTPMENIMYPWISAYTSAIPASVAQAAEFQQALSNTSVNKMDKVQFWTPDNFVYLRNYSMELDWANTYTGSASSTEPFGAKLDNTNKELVMPADGLLFGTSYGGIVSVNGKQIFVSTTDANITNSCFPLEVRKGDVVFMRAYVGTALVPFKYQSGANNLVLGLNYYGKYATLEVLNTASESILNNGQGQGRWALVGDDTNGYTRYYTKPTNNTFSAFEWAAGGADTYLGQETDYVVDRKLPTENDPSWYRVWKSGWLEQGGTIDILNKTITFLKPFADTNYTLVGPGFYIANAGNQSVTKTTTGFTTTSIANLTGTQYWEAKGMGA